MMVTAPPPPGPGGAELRVMLEKTWEKSAWVRPTLKYQSKTLAKGRWLRVRPRMESVLPGTMLSRTERRRVVELELTSASGLPSGAVAVAVAAVAVMPQAVTKG